MLAYLISRERAEDDDKELRDLKSRLFAAHPDWDVDKLFQERDELAPMLTEEQMESQGPMSANEIEAAIQIMKDLGFAVQDISDEDER